MAVLFDLDQTLINSTCAEACRRSRRWNDVYRIIPQMQAYTGIPSLMSELKAWHIPICIVTSSPRSYCNRILAHMRWQVDAIVCYHDTGHHKPHPEPMIEALMRLGIRSDEAVAVGDHSYDIIAAKAAGVFSIGVLWGCHGRQEFVGAQPDQICRTVPQLRSFLMKCFL